MQSNYTLRFPRTSREAYGHDAKFRRHDPDKYVFVAVLIALAFVAGMVVAA